MSRVQKVCNIVFGSNCNLNCRYCFEKYWPKQDYKFDPIIIDYIKHKHKDSPPEKFIVRYFGGEPLLYWNDMKKCIEGFKDCFFEQEVITNGTLLTKEMVDIFNEYGMLVNLSHDGIKTEYNRGYDVLEDKDLYDLILHINHIRFSSVCTTDNDLNAIDAYFRKKFPHKEFSIIFNKFVKTKENQNTINYEDAEDFLYKLHEYNLKNNIPVIRNPKVGLYLYSDGTFRNPRTNNIVGVINRDTLDMDMIPGVYKKELESSACDMDKCQYTRYCSYAKIQLESSDYCKKHCAFLKKLYTDPYEATEGIALYLGNKCNRNCSYCRDSLLDIPRPEANEDNIPRFIEFVSKFKHLQKITFIGGEPLVYIPYIKNIVSMYPNLKYSIITNAVLLEKDDIFNFLKDHNFTIAFSHDGPNTVLTKGYNVLDNPVIVDRLKWFNIQRKLTIQTVIAKDTNNLIDSLYYFKKVFPINFQWRLMFVQGENYSKTIPEKETLDNIFKFFNLYQYESIAARCLHDELSNKFEPSKKNETIYMDLDFNIGVDPLDTTHPFSEENYYKYVASIKRNSNVKKCKDCSIKNKCNRNFSLCNPYIQQLREKFTDRLIQFYTGKGYTDILDFLIYLENENYQN